MKLENWSVVTPNPYLPPEASVAYLSGNVYGHPKHEDGKKISTSRIVSTNSKIVTTISGSVYELGEIDPGYLQYLKNNNIEYREHEPIRITVIKSDDETANCKDLH